MGHAKPYAKVHPLLYGSTSFHLQDELSDRRSPVKRRKLKPYLDLDGEAVELPGIKSHQILTSASCVFEKHAQHESSQQTAQVEGKACNGMQGLKVVNNLKTTCTKKIRR